MRVLHAGFCRFVSLTTHAHTRATRTRWPGSLAQETDERTVCGSQPHGWVHDAKVGCLRLFTNIYQSSASSLLPSSSSGGQNGRGSPTTSSSRPLRRSSSARIDFRNISSATTAAESAHSEISVVICGTSHRSSREGDMTCSSCV